MDRQNSTAATMDEPNRPSRAAVAVPPARRAGDVQRACAITQAVVETAFGQPGQGLRAAAFARQTAMYLAHVGFGISMAEVGRAFGRDRTTVVHACHLVEDRRDDAGFDVLLDHLEQAATALRAASGIAKQG